MVKYLLLCAGKNNDSQPIRRNKRKGIYRGSRDDKGKTRRGGSWKEERKKSTKVRVVKEDNDDDGRLAKAFFSLRSAAGSAWATTQSTTQQKAF